MEKYERIRVVGRGAFGTVYLCRRVSDQRLVIIKQIPVEQMSKEERQAALNEGRVLAMLQHPNIIEYYENFLQDKAMMIVMEYAPGGTLHEYLQQRGDNLLEEEEIIRLFAQMLLSLQHVHSRQILHRDLKTQNILLNRQKDIVKIGDFGISKILSSKSKAYTVVGTPCYISPELCEGKPYNQKSDIWALGCVLYELITLKRAFEAATLPALILKILRGTFAPIADHYSDGLKHLLLSLLHLDPNKRPTISQVMAQPLMINALTDLQTDIGKIPYIARPHELTMPGSALSDTKDDHKVDAHGKHSDASKPLSVPVVYCWGGGLAEPVRLPLLSSDTEMVQVATGRTNKMAVTKNGRVIIWEATSNLTDTTGHSTRTPPPSFIPRFLEGQSALVILQVACGDLFTACLTDRGILLTFGSGVNGCLGHGDHADIAQAKIVEALLGFEVTQVACGTSHVMVITNDHQVFAWGRGDNGRLGLGSHQSYTSPQKVPTPETCELESVVCGINCSVLLTSDYQLLACGSNRMNKLFLDNGHTTEEVQIFHPISPSLWEEENVRSIALGTSHAAVLTDAGHVYTSGSNQFGQLGRDNAAEPRHPGLVDDRFDVEQVACGDAFTVATNKDGHVYSWGKGARGRLGIPSATSNMSRPTRISLPTNDPLTVTSLACNYGNTVLLAIQPLRQKSQRQ